MTKKLKTDKKTDPSREPLENKIWRNVTRD